MKLHCMYWTLLLISFISSCVLFLIVASEAIPGPISKIKNKYELLDNVTIKDIETNDGEILETLNVLNSEIQLELNDKNDETNKYAVDENILREDENLVTSDIQQTNNLNVLKESVTQQPNLSQGISQTGQAVILTLVDTASVELQNLAEPHLSSDIRAQDSTKNLSQTSTKNVESDSIVTIPTNSLPTVLLSTENLNSSDSSELNEIIEDIKNDSEENIVVMVGGDEKLVDDLSKNSFDSIVDINDKIIKANEDSYKIDEVLSSSGEFDNEAVRTKFNTGNFEDTASVILDGVLSTGGVEHHEDIPSFSEWAQKRLEEAEKKKTHPNESTQNPGGGPGRGAGGMKVRSKNYASPDCGAKIVAVNPEARSARSVLVSTRDEYMLNACTSRIWFVVELCEAIQAKKIELANFELFSSSPKDFSVFVSDRFPTRDWSAVGHFTAKDERDIQSFALYPHLFGKFIKIELHSHYGSEHFCPISLFRAYGTSEFEVLETETDVQEMSDSDDNDDDDDDDEETLDGDGSESSRNLFGSARDAVIRIVKKAAAVLVKTGNLDMNNITKIQESIEDNIKSSFANCMTPRYTILCNNCTDDHFAKIFHLLSCQTDQLDSIIKISFINRALHRSELCGIYGVDINTNDKYFNNKKKYERKMSCVKNLPARFLSSVLSSEYIVALCNVIATKERKLVLNTSNEAVGNLSTDHTQIIDIINTKTDVTNSVTIQQLSPTCISDMTNCRMNANAYREIKRQLSDGTGIKDEILNTAIRDIKSINSMENFKTTEILASQIKPTKTFSKEDFKRESSVPILEPSKDTAEETIQADVITTPSPLLNSATNTINVIDEPLSIGTSTETVTQTILSQLNNIDSDESASMESVMIKIEAENQKLDIDSGIKIEEKDEKLKEKENEDIKLTVQEQLSLESLLSDLKDLDVDSHGQSNSASTVAPLAASNTPQQKESVFLRLSNRIKALEQNMSLSGQYLEELSRRYKKQVEEMQRSLDRATAVIGEELKKNEEREFKRLEEISILREELSNLSESMELLLYDRNSWKSKLSTFGQHIALIIIEITVLVLIISYCRRSSDLEDIQTATKMKINEDNIRRKSVESMDSTVKKNKKRRPSEIASVIVGTYRDLMIDDRFELRKENKKKRKRKSLIDLTSNITSKREFLDKIIPSRRISSIDYSNTKEIDYYSKIWPNSAPDCSYHSTERQLLNKDNNVQGNSENYLTQNRIIIDEIDGNNDEREFIIGDVNQHGVSSDINEFDKGISRSNSPRNLNFFKNTHIHSPLFIKTALKTRSKRNKFNCNNLQSDAMNSDSCDWHSRTSGSSRSGQDSPPNLTYLDTPNIDGQYNGESSTNGHYGVSDDSGSGSTTPLSGKKIKKEGSLRKMVRKLF